MALSTKKLSDEQKQQILISAGLISTEKQLTASQFSERLATELNSKADAKQLLISSGIVTQKELEEDASVKVTAATLNEAVAKGTLSPQNAAVIAGALGITGVNAGEALSFELLTASIWANIKAFGVLLASNPVTWIVGGLVALVGVLDFLTVSTKEYEEELNKLKDNLESVKSECSELESELASCNDELTTTQERMRELEKMDSLTFAEKEEYDNLVATNNELERKIELLELEQKIKDREKQEAFIQAMEKDANEGNEYWQDGETGRIAKGDAMWAQIGGMLAFDATEKEYILQQFETRQNLEEELLKAIEDGNLELVDSIENQIGEIDSYLISKSSEWDTMSEGISYISNPTTEDEKAVNAWLDYIADFQSRMAIAIGGDSAKTNAFNRLVDNWQFDDTVQELQDLGAEGKVTADMLNDPKYDEFINKLVEIGVIDSADDLDLIALAFNGIAFEAENASDAVESFTENLPPTITDTVDAIHTKLKPAMDSLADAYNKMFTENGFTHDGITTSEFTGIKEDLDAMSEAGLDIDYSEYENFVKVLSDVDSTSDDVHDAFDSLATMMVNSSNVVNLTEENFNLLKQQLEELGVTNAEEVLTNLREAQIQLKSAGIDLRNVTLEEAVAFINSAEASETARKYLQNYALQKEIAGKPLSTVKDIEALEDVCEALGVTGEYYEKLAHLKYLYASADAGGIWGDKSIQNEIARTKAELEAIANNQYEYEIEIDYKAPDTGGSGGGSSSSKDTYKEKFEKELSELQYLRDMGVLNEKEYLDKLKVLNEKYFKDKAKYIEEFRKYEKEYYQGMLDVMNTVITAVTDTLDEQIEKLEEQKTTIEEYYSLQIESIQETIDSMQAENDEIDRNMALQKARYQLARSLNQRTALIYREGRGYVYEADPKSVKEDQEAVDEAEFQKVIGDLESEIERLEKAMKTETDAIDDQIKSLEKYRDKWSDVVKDYERGINKQIASMILGKDWESKVLNQRLDILNAFKDQYIGIQEAMQQSALETAKIQAEASTPTTPSGGSGGVNKGSNPVDNGLSFMEQRAKTVHIYNGKEYSTSNEAAAARAKDAESAYKQELVHADRNGMPSDVREKLANQKKQEILKRPITKVEKYAKGGIIKKDNNNDILTLLARSIGEDKMVAVGEDEVILDPQQGSDYIKLANLSEKLTPLINNANSIERMFNVSTPTLPQISNTPLSQPIYNTFNVSLPNITDSSRATDLIREFEQLYTKGVQYFNTKK